jgi:imidazolonepropionase-like amidohydrolase
MKKTLLFLAADLLIIDGDPSKNISDLRKLQYVFKNGVVTIQKNYSTQ